MKSKVTLGISAFYHDSAICYIKNNKLISCLQEERFSRKKHDAAFPINAFNALKTHFGLNENEITSIVFYDKPILKFERIISNLIEINPKGFLFSFKALPITINEKLFIANTIRKYIKGNYLINYIPHHISHAISAFLPSKFNSAAFMINDGVGEWHSSSFGIIDKRDINIMKSIHYPHSLGLLYSAFTYFCGFRVNSGEYKLMGLAPYGEPIYFEKLLNNIIDIKSDGSYRLNLKYFEFQYGSRMCGKNMEDLLKLKIRKPESKITNEYADIAASIQKLIEYVLILMAKYIKKQTNMDNLVMAGGVALNCVANSKIIKQSGFKNVFIQPASGDAGGALGAALYKAHYIDNMEFDNIQNYSYLGTLYDNDYIKTFLENNNIEYEELKEPAKTGAEIIANGNVLGWFQGRMEYGPRALGNRSILADPRDKDMQRKVNMKIKFRESFRPFAPSVLEERYNEYFEESFYTPYMLTVSTLKKEHRKIKEHIIHDFDILNKYIADIPAVIHADFSSRIQIVNKNTNKLYYELIKHFYKLTDVPLILNTSFNIRGEPIVENPEQAYKTFKKTYMDYLIMGNYLIKKGKEEDVK